MIAKIPYILIHIVALAINVCLTHRKTYLASLNNRKIPFAGLKENLCETLINQIEPTEKSRYNFPNIKVDIKWNIGIESGIKVSTRIDQH